MLSRNLFLNGANNVTEENLGTRRLSVLLAAVSVSVYSFTRRSVQTSEEKCWLFHLFAFGRCREKIQSRPGLQLPLRWLRLPRTSFDQQWGHSSAGQSATFARQMSGVRISVAPPSFYTLQQGIHFDLFLASNRSKGPADIREVPVLQSKKSVRQLSKYRKYEFVEAPKPIV